MKWKRNSVKISQVIINLNMIESKISDIVSTLFNCYDAGLK